MRIDATPDDINVGVESFVDKPELTLWKKENR
jgi:hypothetical protein